MRQPGVTHKLWGVSVQRTVTLQVAAVASGTSGTRCPSHCFRRGLGKAYGRRLKEGTRVVLAEGTDSLHRSITRNRETGVSSSSD